MRYKNNVLDKLNQIDTSVNKLQIQINRNSTKEQMSETTQLLKDLIEEVRNSISIEPDDFERQFSGR